MTPEKFVDVHYHAARARPFVTCVYMCENERTNPLFPIWDECVQQGWFLTRRDVAVFADTLPDGGSRSFLNATQSAHVLHAWLLAKGIPRSSTLYPYREDTLQLVPGMIYGDGRGNCIWATAATAGLQVGQFQSVKEWVQRAYPSQRVASGIPGDTTWYCNHLAEPVTCISPHEWVPVCGTAMPRPSAFSVSLAPWADNVLVIHPVCQQPPDVSAVMLYIRKECPFPDTPLKAPDVCCVCSSKDDLCPVMFNKLPSPCPFRVTVKHVRGKRVERTGTICARCRDACRSCRQ
jgi:hypothetical protein